jgi:hypothetical protein
LKIHTPHFFPGWACRTSSLLSLAKACWTLPCVVPQGGMDIEEWQEGRVKHSLSIAGETCLACRCNSAQGHNPWCWDLVRHRASATRARWSFTHSGGHLSKMRLCLCTSDSPGTEWYEVSASFCFHLCPLYLHCPVYTRSEKAEVGRKFWF